MLVTKNLIIGDINLRLLAGSNLESPGQPAAE